MKKQRLITKTIVKQEFRGINIDTSFSDSQ